MQCAGCELSSKHEATHDRQVSVPHATVLAVAARRVLVLALVPSRDLFAVLGALLKRRLGNVGGAAELVQHGNDLGLGEELLGDGGGSVKAS
jgi:hypothetical protein